MSRFAEEAKKKIEQAKEDRMNEINFVVGIVDNFCEEAQIGLVAREIKGTLRVVVLDARSGKEYVIQKIGDGDSE